MVKMKEVLSYRDMQWLFDKTHLLPTLASEALALHGSRQRSLFFDVGASLYTSGDGGASQAWFDTLYARHNLTFDRIFAWEATPHTDAAIFSALPTALRSRAAVYRTAPPAASWPPPSTERLSYFNFGVSARRGAADNPWVLLRAEARPADFVVVKVDIDTPGVEQQLVDALLADDTLLALVDELYYEHHVRGSPMMAHGWGLDGANMPTQTLAQSYELFRAFREAGVRAHSWV